MERECMESRRTPLTYVGLVEKDRVGAGGAHGDQLAADHLGALGLLDVGDDGGQVGVDELGAVGGEGRLLAEVVQEGLDLVEHLVLLEELGHELNDELADLALGLASLDLHGL